MVVDCINDKKKLRCKLVQGFIKSTFSSLSGISWDGEIHKFFTSCRPDVLRNLKFATNKRCN